MWKTILAVLSLIMLFAGSLFLLFIGPWPTYSKSDVLQESYYLEARAGLEVSAQTVDLTSPLEMFRAGWARADLTPPVGTPLAGYGDRQGRPSEGVHDPLFVKAVAVSDGRNTAVIAGSDLLIVPENVADAVRNHLQEHAGLPPDRILFNASHTHSGPGAFAPGLLPSMFAGAYIPEIYHHIVNAFIEAITDALDDMHPARFGHGYIDASDMLRNRARDAEVDGIAQFFVIERTDGARCIAMRCSAHATVLSGKNMLISGDYPGFVQARLERESNTFGVFLGGAMGSMAPVPPVSREDRDDFARARAMGDELAHRVLEALPLVEYTDQVEVVSVGTGFRLPSLQLRLTKGLRVSPFLLNIAGLDSDGWVQGLRIGDLLLYGTPADFSGEIAITLRAEAARHGIELWVLGFNGDYAGYISPDRYYTHDVSGTARYELYTMSWCGPNQEALFAALCNDIIRLTRTKNSIARLLNQSASFLLCR